MRPAFPAGGFPPQDRRELRAAWRRLPAAVRALVVVLAVLSLAVLLMLLGVQARLLGLADASGMLGTLRQVLADPTLIRTDPVVSRRYWGLLAWLLTALVLMTADAALNLFTCIAASVRKEYPSGHDRATWVAGLWAVFLLMQLPTGVPSAFAYWFFVARPARRAAVAAGD